MSLSEKDRAAIIAEALTGLTTFAAIGRRFGVSREYIRQLAAEEGIIRRVQTAERRADKISEDVLAIIADREQWVPARWAKRPYTKAQFLEWLMSHDEKLHQRWRDADELPTSRSGRANPDEQQCIDCDEWFPWHRFYPDKSRPFKKSARCKECARAQAKEARA